MTELLKHEERAVFALRELYQSYGYTQFKMSKFEAYDLYARNKDFLVSDSVITFTDTDGTLMALKPDVTLSMVKNYRKESGCVQKLYYNENVYRIGGAGRTYREILQTGLEVLGEIGPYELCETVVLAVKSLQAISEDYILDLSHMGLVNGLLAHARLRYDQRAQALRCIGEKNEDGLRQICHGLAPEQLEQLISLVRIYGPLEQALDQLTGFDGSPAVVQLRSIAAVLRQAGLAGRINLDFSIVSDGNYYNGVVFRGYVAGIPNRILSGGQYDKLMEKMGKDAGGVGFAVYLDQLELLDRTQRPYDMDTVVLYDKDVDLCALFAAVAPLRKSGESLLTAQKIPQRLRYRRLLRFAAGKLEEVEADG